MSIRVMFLSHFVNYIFPFCLAVPLGGVTGRPAFNPPYGNFFLSAGFNIYNEKENVLT